MSWVIPSIYWPLARLGFSGSPRLRRLFRLLVPNLYRKRVWNPLLNSWLKERGFNRRRHARAVNAHGVCSALCLLVIALNLHSAWGIAVAARSLPPGSDFGPSALRGCCLSITFTGLFELSFNMPAIVLARYLYLLTFRRPAILRRSMAEPNSSGVFQSPTSVQAFSSSSGAVRGCESR